MRTFAVVPVVLLAVLAATACGGGGGGGDSTSTASPFPTAPDQVVRGCSLLDEKDVRAVAPGGEAGRLDLAPDASVVCSTLFRGSAGQIVLAFSEVAGGLQALRQLRAAKAAELGADTVRSLPALGEGAFIARKRYLAFPHGSEIVVLETGYDSQGALVLSVPQLTQLARVVSERS